MKRRRAVVYGAVAAAWFLVLYFSIGVRRLSRGEFTQAMAAIQALKTIHVAQVQYSSQYGCYATSLAELGPPASGAASASAADILQSDLASGEKQGYKFTMTGNCKEYRITAVPDTFGISGSRTFFSDQTMVIRENDGSEPARADSKELGAK